MTEFTDATDPELAVHADDCRAQEIEDVLELARLGLAFHHETTMMHFLLSCGRDDTPGFEALQRERVALSARITEVKDRLPDAMKEELRMSRLTPDTDPAPRVRPQIKLIEENL